MQKKEKIKHTHTHKKKRRKRRVRLLSGIPLRSFRDLAEMKNAFNVLHAEKLCFLFYCFPSPPVLVGPMKLAVEVVLIAQKTMTKTKETPLCIL